MSKTLLWAILLSLCCICFFGVEIARAADFGSDEERKSYESLMAEPRSMDAVKKAAFIAPRGSEARERAFGIWKNLMLEENRRERENLRKKEISSPDFISIEAEKMYDSCLAEPVTDPAMARKAMKCAIEGSPAYERALGVLSSLEGDQVSAVWYSIPRFVFPDSPDSGTSEEGDADAFRGCSCHGRRCCPRSGNRNSPEFHDGMRIYYWPAPGNRGWGCRKHGGRFRSGGAGRWERCQTCGNRKRSGGTHPGTIKTPAPKEKFGAQGAYPFRPFH